MSTSDDQISPAHRLGRYVTPREAAQIAGFTEKALEMRRWRQKPPRYFKVGGRVRYALDDLCEWLQRNPGEVSD